MSTTRIENDSINLPELPSTPAAPAAGRRKLYAKSDGYVYSVDENGTETRVQAISGDFDAAGLKISMPNLPTSDPHVAGQLWKNGAAVTVSAG